MSDNEYNVFFECRNCKRIYLIYAPKGTAIPSPLDCPYCQVPKSLRKISDRSGGFDKVLTWDGKKLARR
jgi:hypothetical protein